MQLFILAGGQGTRLRKIVSKVPKPMANVHKKPFLNYVLRYWKKQGVESFIISIGYLAEIIESYYGNCFEGIPVRYIQEKTPLGTGGAFLKLLRESTLDKPFIMVNGDTFFEVELFKLEKYHNLSGSIFTVCGFESENTERYSHIFHDTNGRITDFGLKSSEEKNKIVCNGGVYMVSPSVYHHFQNYGEQKCSLETDLIKSLIDKRKNIFVKLFDSPFLDIGLPNDYKNAKEFLKKRRIYNES